MAESDYLCKATEEGRRLFNSLWEVFIDKNSESAVKHYIDDYSLDYVGQGKKRIALIDMEGEYMEQPRACVVKIEKYGETSSNEWEFHNYRKVGNDVQKYLAPITDWSEEYRWVMMPFVDGMPSEREMFELEKIFIYSGWDIGDIRQENVGMVGDKPVVRDYDHRFEELDTDAMSKEERIELKKWRYNMK